MGWSGHGPIQEHGIPACLKLTFRHPSDRTPLGQRSRHWSKWSKHRPSLEDLPEQEDARDEGAEKEDDLEEDNFPGAIPDDGGDEDNFTCTEPEDGGDQEDG
eukprot:3770533-Amphidinium_carterae.1